MRDSYTILIADDEPTIRRVLSAMFEKNRFHVLTAENGKRAVEMAQTHDIDALITDLIMPDMNGVEVLKHVRQLHPLCASIIVTAYGTIKTAVDAMRLGAYTYITKPFDMDDVLQIVKRALEDQARPTAAPAPRAAAPRPQPSSTRNGIVGASPAMENLFNMVERVADSRATVLLRGESGTGKELIARALHFRSIRSDKPFVPVSCAALPETLLESELFGHEKNAFTGAAAQKPGRFELANQGTLFMDEVGEIPPALQVKLLRVIQEREFERLGATKAIKVDVRLVSATNRDLEKAVAAGEFREDLYYRLQVIQLTVPPLRERAEDIPQLAEHFVKLYARENHRAIASISDEAMGMLCAYRFPGNVRELQNVMERAIVLADPKSSVLTPDLLPPGIVAASASAKN